MKSQNTLLGNFQLDIISDGTFRLDGGAMFGVIPRVMWETIMPPDEKNRILLGLNTLLVQTETEKILIDTGIGEKWSAKQQDIYCIRHETTISKSLKSIGLTTKDITLVINTHLHFDHAGGNTFVDKDGNLKPTFSNAKYIVQHNEYKHACSPHERDRASYLSENWQPLVESGQLEFSNGEQEIIPGISVIPIRGHNDYTQCVKIESEGKIAFYWADIIPTIAHLPFAWVMGYDLYPVELLENKKRLIPQSASEQWLNIFEHEPNTPMGYIVEEKGKFKVNPQLSSS